MKLIHTGKNLVTFSLSQREKQLFLRTLQLYPLVPPAHHQLSKSSQQQTATENQQWLEEAVAEQRHENRKHIRALLDTPGRFQETASGIQFSLKHQEIEWLLQVLNDVRIGAWLALGEPEEGFVPEINNANAAHLFAMEVSGHFQVEILAALGLHEPTQLGG